MRQAGRYLPEYQNIRSQFPDFMEFCQHTESVVEVTLQPIRRFGLDAAILFSDILTIPHFMGQPVSFIPKVGPILGPIEIKSFTKIPENFKIKMEPILKAITILCQELEPLNTPLIGFAGCPWTLACYMIDRKRDHDNPFQKTLIFGQLYPEVFQNFLNILSEAVIESISLQVRAGCQAIQLFDSWAGLAPHAYADTWLIKPLIKILDTLYHRFPQLPIIYFARGASYLYSQIDKIYAHNTYIGFSVDEAIELGSFTDKLSPKRVLQGNLAPQLLKEGNFEHATDNICKTMANQPYIFNLGHGVLPETPVEHVDQLVKYLRQTC